MHTLTDIQIGYLAGILDGEGCIYQTRRGYGHVIITNTNRECLNSIFKLTGIGMIYRLKKQRYGYTVAYQLRIYKMADVVELLSILLPVLIIKKEQARKMIKRLERS